MIDDYDYDDDDNGTINLIKLSSARLICRPNSDFRNACSCSECDLKIQKVERFQEYINSKIKIITDHYNEVDGLKEICSCICSAANWTKWMLWWLHKKIDELYEESGTLQIPEASRPTVEAYQKIIKTLVENDLFVKSEDHSLEQIYELLDASIFSREIDRGYLDYGKTNVKESADALLKEIENTERIHDNDKKNAEGQNEKLDPSISKNHIQKQIELLRRLPMEKMQVRIEQVIDQVCPLDAHELKFDQTWDYIDKTVMVMIRKSEAFWRCYRKQPSKEHSSNKLDQTLDFLICKADLFKDEWETKYTPFYDRPFYRSDPKRQRIEK